MKKTTLFILGLVTSLSCFIEPVEANSSNAKVLGTDTGRYVFGQISDFRSDQFLMDTETGRLWRLVVDEKDNPKMEPVPIMQIRGEKGFTPEPF